VLIQVDGIRLFHCGDANAKSEEVFKHFNLSDEKIDIALLDRIFMFHPTAPGIQIITEYIKPKNIILMHIAPGKSQTFMDIGKLLSDQIPHIFVFDKPMVKKTYHL
jgi:L-ascorbate metabolism protein UlaG (beta-lactamase superfamily)